MKIIDCLQGSPEWLSARIGVPTASNFEKIISPVKMKPSASQDKYLAHILSEWFLGSSLEEADSQFMERGRELEPDARVAYEFEHDVTTRQVGFVTTDDGRFGASPDALVGDDGLLEVKCPAIHTHMEYLIEEAEGTAGRGDYFCQCQGQLLVCEREWVDRLYYHPILPPVRVRVQRDPEFIAALERCMGAFLTRLDACKARLADARAKYHDSIQVAQEASEVDPDPFASLPEELHGIWSEPTNHDAPSGSLIDAMNVNGVRLPTRP